MSFEKIVIKFNDLFLKPRSMIQSCKRIVKINKTDGIIFNLTLTKFNP